MALNETKRELESHREELHQANLQLKESIQLGCFVSRFPSEHVYSAERLKIGIKSHRQLLQGHVAPHKKIGERKGPSRGVTHKCEPRERSPCAPRFEERTQDETLHQERCARRVAWDLVKMSTRSKNDR